MEKLLWVGDQKALQEAGIYLKPATFHRWHCVGKHPRLFCKIGRRLFIRERIWEEIVQKAIAEAEKRAERFENLGL